MNVPVKIIASADATLPKYQTFGSAGMDLCTTIDFVLAAGERMMVPTGLRIALPEGYEAQVRPRSGLAVL
jgi:dUTP pyrophosphatase